MSEILAKGTLYPELVVVFKPNTAVISMSNAERSTLSKGPKTDEYETTEERSLRRTRKSIKDLVLMNDFDMFVTLTIAHDRSNPEHSKNKIANWLKNQRNRNGQFDYLLVPEFHKKANALHFHALFGGYKGRISLAHNPKSGDLLTKNGRALYNLDEYKSGYSSVIKIDASQTTATKLAFYLQKYLTKDIQSFFGKQRYWASKGLKKPLKFDIYSRWFELVQPRHVQPTDYGDILYFDRADVEDYLG